MSDARAETAAVLERVAAQLDASSLPRDMADEVRRLARDVFHPCVVAVVGRVNAGKSTFINTLLGRSDKAVVGTTETTATINYFSYGTPDPARPVRCRWRNGQVTEETRSSWQHFKATTWRRSAAPTASIAGVPDAASVARAGDAVDTPGLGAVVAEHEERATEFIRVRAQLRRRHDEESRQLQDTADAVVYLIGQVALTSDRELLGQFHDATSGSASARNALGVIAKIDLDQDVLARRAQLASKIGRQLARS